MHDDCVFVRPTGNPLNKDGWNNMMNNKDVVVESNDLVTINKVKIVGDMAFVCYTTHGKFSYKGTENDDIAVISSVLQRVDGKWMVVHGQRSTGRKPSDEAPKFA
jgi:ketosteroid isomerase-like protein